MNKPQTIDALTRKPKPKRTERARLSAHKRGYDAIWQRFRKYYLDDHPLCVEHLRIGKTIKATDIDHIVPLRNGGAKYDDHNLQALCHQCHSKKTAAGQ